MIDLENPAWDNGDEYAFGEDIQFTIPKLTHDIRPVGNQQDYQETRSACTLVWAVNQIIRLFGIELTRDKTGKLYLEVVKYAAKHWYVIGSGWDTPTACNTVCKWRNEIGYKTFWKEQVFWLRLLRDNKRIKEALDKWHLIGYTKKIQFGKDQVDGLVFRDKYPESIGHRLNWKGKTYTKATGWANWDGAECWSQDNYHGAAGENFFFKTRSKYINHGIYAYCYLILPISSMTNTIEEEKEQIKLNKAINALVWVMSSTYGDIDQEFQLMSSAYATALRDRYPEARPIIKDQTKKVYQSVVDFLSYARKFAGEEEQKTYAELAEHLRQKFNLQ